MTREVGLTRGKVALVDDDDYGRVLSRGWCAHLQVRSGVETWYAIASSKLDKCLLHRFVLGLRIGDGLLVDHRNGDGLDCRRHNLRICTRSQNAMNRRSTAKRRLPKGVSAAGSRYTARLMLDGSVMHLGTFDTPELAACAYDAAATKQFGEFARINGVTA